MSHKSFEIGSSESIENYLKGMYLIKEKSKRSLIGTGDLAKELGVSVASASEMILKLEKLGFVEIEKYKGVYLASEGEKIAKGMVRRHRILEVFFHKTLKLNDYYERAHKMEHAVDDEMLERLFEFLKKPLKSPDGKEIPS